LQAAMQKAVTEAVAFQRDLHVLEEIEAEQAIKAEGCEIVTLDAGQHDAFAAAVRPITAEARETLGTELFDLIGRS
jgi:TRAP-type C4-dicarboxylate transport system substrate-binding protein